MSTKSSRFNKAPETTIYRAAPAPHDDSPDGAACYVGVPVASGIRRLIETDLHADPYPGIADQQGMWVAFGDGGGPIVPLPRRPRPRPRPRPRNGPLVPLPRFRMGADSSLRFPFENMSDEELRQLAKHFLGSYDDPRRPEFRSLGYKCDYPDGRDYDLSRFIEKSTDLQKKKFRNAFSKDSGAVRVHLGDRIGRRRGSFGPIQDQGMYGTCTAHAVTDMMEFHYRKFLAEDPKEEIEFSRLFAYKMGRTILGWDGDNGCQIRAVIKGIMQWGVPREEHWPYVDGLLEQHPSPEVFARAKQYNGTLGKLAYYRVGKSILKESMDCGRDPLVAEIRALLSCGLPVACGLFLATSSSAMQKDHVLPVPDLNAESWIGGHAVLIVGYDDRVSYRVPGEKVEQKGAFIIRNSWKESWGDLGYGFLPYFHVEQGYAEDCWVARAE